jgi:hypothetical protein
VYGIEYIFMEVGHSCIFCILCFNPDFVPILDAEADDFDSGQDRPMYHLSSNCTFVFNPSIQTGVIGINGWRTNGGMPLIE